MHAFPTQQSQTARYRSAARGGHPYQSARHRAGSRSEIGDWLSLLLSLSIQEGAVMPSAPLAGSPQGAHLVMASYLRGQRLCYPQTIQRTLSNFEVSGYRRGCLTWRGHG